MRKNAHNDFNHGSTLIAEFATRLNPRERDSLKYRLSVAAIKEMNHVFEQPQSKADGKFFKLLENLCNIQPYADRIPQYGLVYRGRPDFMTNEILESLINEARIMRKWGRYNIGQVITRIETDNNNTVSEKLAASEELYALVSASVGSCLRSFVTSYVYYDAPGHCSRPHVDNAFTEITAMVGLRHDYKDSCQSSSIIYWPNKQPFEYRLEPGEIAIFFGSSVLHGRTPVSEGEVVESLLLSFRCDNSESASTILCGDE